MIDLQHYGPDDPIDIRLKKANITGLVRICLQSNSNAARFVLIEVFQELGILDRVDLQDGWKQDELRELWSAYLVNNNRRRTNQLGYLPPKPPSHDTTSELGKRRLSREQPNNL